MFPLAQVSLSAVARRDFLLCEIKRSVGFPVKSDAVAVWNNIGIFFFYPCPKKETHIHVHIFQLSPNINIYIVFDKWN